MGYFRIVGVGAQASGPIEQIAATAREAEVRRYALHRLCGKHGTVGVSGQDGREIRLERLRRLARDEEAADEPHAGNTDP